MERRYLRREWVLASEPSLAHRIRRRRTPLPGPSLGWRALGLVAGLGLAAAGFALPIKGSLMGPAPRPAFVSPQTVHASVIAAAPPLTGAIEPGMLEAARRDYFRTRVPYGSIVYREAQRYGLDPELVAAVIEAESAFDPRAVSHRNARGLMQIVPATAEWMGEANISSPERNIMAGARYLDYLHRRFHGNLTLVLAAYNAGEGNVVRHGGVPPFGETRQYLRRVAANMERHELALAQVAADWRYAAPEMIGRH